MAGIVVDTSVLISAERQVFDFAALLRSFPHDQGAIAAITAAELFHGYERASTAARRAHRGAFVDRLLAEVAVLPFTLATARHHARVWAALSRRGTPVGYHDLLIAATALEVGSEVATPNRREFERVAGLTLTDITPYVQA